MFPTALTEMARGNPFRAPLFSLQKVDEPQPSQGQQQMSRRLAAAATADGNPRQTLCSLAAVG